MVIVISAAHHIRLTYSNRASTEATKRDKEKTVVHHSNPLLFTDIHTAFITVNYCKSVDLRQQDFQALIRSLSGQSTLHQSLRRGESRMKIVYWWIWAGYLRSNVLHFIKLTFLSCICSGLFTQRFTKSNKWSRAITCDYSDSMARRRIRADTEINSSPTMLDLVRCCKLDSNEVWSIDAFHHAMASFDFFICHLEYHKPCDDTLNRCGCISDTASNKRYSIPRADADEFLIRQCDDMPSWGRQYATPICWHAKSIRDTPICARREIIFWKPRENILHVSKGKKVLATCIIVVRWSGWTNRPPLFCMLWQPAANVINKSIDMMLESSNSNYEHLCTEVHAV